MKWVVIGDIEPKTWFLKNYFFHLVLEGMLEK